MRLITAAGGFALAALLLWVFFHNTDWSAVRRSIGAAHLGLLGLCFAGNAASLLLRSARWQVLLRPLAPRLGLTPAWRYFTIGFALSSLLPGRPGEVVRPYLMARHQRLGFAPTFATVVTERVIDLLAVLTLLGIGFVTPGVLDRGAADSASVQAVEALRSFGLLALSVAVAVAAFLVAVKVRTELALGLVRWLSRPLPRRVGERLQELVRSFADGIGGLGAGQVAAVIGTTLATWLVLALATGAALEAFGLSQPFSRVLFLLAVLALGVAVPTPAGTGTYHAGAVLVLGTVWGLGDTQAPAVAAFALVSHVVAYIPTVLFGVESIAREGVAVLATTDQARRASAQGDDGDKSPPSSAPG